MVLLPMLREVSKGSARSNGFLTRKSTSVGRQHVKILKPNASSSRSLDLNDLCQEIHNIVVAVFADAGCLYELLSTVGTVSHSHTDCCGGGIITGVTVATPEVHSSCTTAAMATVA